MADTLTPFLGLAKPDFEGAADIRVVNANFDVLDAAAARNLLTNPGFEVWQRGPGPFTASGGYAADRWQVNLGGTSLATVTDETGLVDAGSAHAMRVVYTQGTVVSRIDQRLEAPQQLRGRAVSFAVRLRAGLVGAARPYVEDAGVTTYGPANAGVGAYETLAVAAAVGAGSTSVRVGVELAATTTVYLDSATFAPGAAAVAFAPLHPSEDLARCQRYYQEIGGLDPNEFLSGGQNTSATNGLISFRFPVEMAVTPTVAVSAPGDWEVLTAAGSVVACTGLGPGLVTRRSCRLQYTVVGGLVAGNATVMRANTSAARVTFAANPP